MIATGIPLDRFNKKSRVIFFTGAGISAESGIATFRDPDGHWSKYDPMKLASPAGFRADPDLVLAWYAARRETIANAKPNLAHLSITNFQKLFQETLVITQNVDGLHQAAGNHSVYELHGSIHRQKCVKCDADLGQIKAKTIAKLCGCGGRARPDVVWFGESLPHGILDHAFGFAEKTDLCFVIGTSSQVYPSAQLPHIVKRNGGYVVEINPEKTILSDQANISLRGLAGELLPRVYEEFYASLN